MIAVYYNYPNSGFTIHENCSVEKCQTHKKVKQRVLCIKKANLLENLKDFYNQKYRFGSVQELNDMWLEIDFGDNTLEIAIAECILFLLGKQYKPFRDIVI